MSKLYAGAARRSIDPAPDMYPMPTHFNIADDIYDSCHVRAIALRAGDEKALMLIYELSDYPAVPELKEKVSAATGFAPEEIFITVTHNHTSPCDTGNDHPGHAPESEEIRGRRQRYKEIELASTLEAACEAVNSMRPAGIGYGTIDSYINVNRDFKNKFGYWVEAPNYAGYSYKTLAVLKLVDEDGKLIAALLNHGTHSTCAFIHKDVDGKYKLSGNFSGIAARFAEEYYGGDAVIAWTAGAAGNQNPIMSHGLQYEYPDGYTTSVPVPDGMGYMEAEYLGRRHGADAIDCINSIADCVYDISITHRETIALLPAQKKRQPKPGEKLNNRMGGNGLRDYAKVPYGQLPPVVNRADAMVPNPDNPVKMYMHLIKLGDVALLLTNGEMYAELGREVRAESPMEKTVVITYSLAQSTSYILDDSSADHMVFQSFSPATPGKCNAPILAAVDELFA